MEIFIGFIRHFLLSYCFLRAEGMTSFRFPLGAFLSHGFVQRSHLLIQGYDSIIHFEYLRQIMNCPHKNCNLDEILAISITLNLHIFI